MCGLAMPFAGPGERAGGWIGLRGRADIESGDRDSAVTEGLIEGGLIDQAAASHVPHDEPRLDIRERLPTEDPLRGVGEPRAQDQGIGPGQDVIE
jgi:hypothetical protein